MEDSARTKIELVKPVFLKAGIPIAISLAGFILARFALGRKNIKDFVITECHVDSSPEILCSDQESCHNDLDISDGDMYLLDNLDAQNRRELEEEIVCLKDEVKFLQGREMELKLQFLRFLEMKDQEMQLLELENRLSLEVVKSEFLNREILAMEAETKRFEGMILDFLKLIRLFQISRLENKVLYRRIRRLLREAKENSCIIERKDKQIEAGEAEILQNHEELSRRADRIKVLEDKLLELKFISEKQEEEKNELTQKLSLAEKSASLKTEEGTGWDNYNRLLCEFEQLQRDRAAELKELVYLRWCNACLRHELIRKSQEQGKNLEINNSHQVESRIEENELEEGQPESPSSADDRNDSKLECTTPSRDHAHSKKFKLIEKFKRWVEGSEKMKPTSRAKHDEVVNCFGKHLVANGAEENLQFSATSSCSSTYQNSPTGLD